ncbi:MAG: DMT family transporter [Clostridiales bacterium]|nr:DMT family transporter [Clostridiales bacterium]
MKKLIIILGVIGVSVSAPLIRFSSAPSMVLVLYRVLIAALLLSPAIALKNRAELRSISHGDLALCLVSGLFLGLHFSCYFEALRFTSIASAVALVDTEVFFVAFMLLILFKERIPWLAWVGIVITFVGSVLIAWADAGDGTNVLLGDLIALAGAFCMAVYTIIGKTCRQRITTTTYTFLVYLSAGITVLVILVCSGRPLLGYGPVNWWTALGMAVFCTLLGHSVFSWGLKYESAAFIATAKLLEPVFASILGLLLFREVPQAMVIIGGCIVVAGLILTTGCISGRKKIQ